MSTEHPIHIGPVFPCAYCLTSFINTHFLFKHLRKCHARENNLLVKENLPENESTLIKSVLDVASNSDLISKKSDERIVKKSSTVSSVTLNYNLRIEDCSPDSLNILNELHCTICDRRFQDNYELRKHIQTHIVENSDKLHDKVHNRIKCKVCQKQTSSMSSFIKHIKFHIGLYVCKFCNKIYSNFNNYLMHLESHNEFDQTDQIIKTASFTCRCCYEEFDDVKEIICHLKLVHSKNDEKRVKCMICNLEYDNFAKYQHHLKFHLKFTNVNAIQDFLENQKKNKLKYDENPSGKRIDKNIEESDVKPEAKRLKTEKLNCEKNDIPPVVKIVNLNCIDNDVTPVDKLPETNKSNCEENDVTTETNKSNCEENDVTSDDNLPEINKSNCEQNEGTSVDILPEKNKSNSEQNDVTSVDKLPETNKSNCEDNEGTSVDKLPENKNSICEKNNFMPFVKIVRLDCEQSRIMPADKITQVNCHHCNRTFRNDDLYQTHLDSCLNLNDVTMSDVATISPTLDEQNLPFIVLDNPPIVEQKINKNLNSSNHCRLCNKNFPHINLYNKHFLLFHDVNTSFHCRKCNERFLTKLKYMHHMKTKHKNPNSYIKCRFCHREFLHTLALRQHMLLHKHSHLKKVVPESQIIIPNSNIREVVLPSDRQHVLPSDRQQVKKIPVKKYECSTCHRCFRNKYSYDTHMINHRSKMPKNTNPVKCPICHKGFSTSNSLRGHMGTHKLKNRQEEHYKYKNLPENIQKDDRQTIEKKPRSTTARDSNQCPFCLKTFQANFFLLGHIGTHKNEGYPDYNNVIEELFTSFKENSVNEETDTTVEMTEMDNIRQTDNTENNFSLPIMPNSFRCSYCPKKFTSKAGVLTHERIHKKQQINPGFDGIIQGLFNQQTNKQKIDKTKQTSTDNAKKRFPSPKPMIENYFKCSYNDCTSMFSTKQGRSNHERVHTRTTTTKRDEFEEDTNNEETDKTMETDNSENDFPSSPQENFPCSYCNKIFNTKSGLINHERMHKRQLIKLKIKRTREAKRSTETSTNEAVNTQFRESKCVYCPKKFQTNFALLGHLKQHRNEKTFSYVRRKLVASLTPPSSSAKVQVNTSTTINVEQKTEDKSKRVKCKFCSEKFATNVELLDHLIVHKSEEQQTLNLFKSPAPATTTTSELSTTTTAEDDNNSLCKICNRTFVRKGDFVRHMRMTHSERFDCSECILTFTSLEKLNEHLVSHRKVEIKEYSCNMCVEKFTERLRYDDHVLLHAENKLYICTLCKRSFGRSHDLAKHKSTVHATGLFECTKCKQQFDAQYKLEDHLLLHNPSFKCNLCKREFSFVDELKKHKEDFHDIYECELCNEIFLEKDCFSDHMLAHSMMGQFRREKKSSNRGEVGRKSETVTKQSETPRGKLQQTPETPRIKLQQTPEIPPRKLEHTLETPRIKLQKIPETPRIKLQQTPETPRIKLQQTPETPRIKLQQTPETSRGNLQHQKRDIVVTKEPNIKVEPTNRSPEITLTSLLHTTFQETTQKPKPTETPSVRSIDKKLSSTDHSSEFRCNLCKTVYETKYELVEHKDRLHDIYECEICSQQFLERAVHDAHFMTHPKQTFFCEFCGWKFFRSCDLKKHKNVHIEATVTSKAIPEKIKCEICELEFTTEAELRRHNHCHFECSICKATFESQIKLTEHRITHKTFKCEICSWEFTIEEDYIKHKENHVEKCPICNDKFTDMIKLKQHIEEHQDSLFRCSSCTQSFDDENDLINHKAIDHDIHECDICKKQFTVKDVLDKHMLKHLDNLYTCNICPETFSTRSEFTRHKQTHNEEFQCIICQLKLPSRQIYYKHLLLHKTQHEQNLPQPGLDPNEWITPESEPEDEIEALDQMETDTDSVRTYPCDICYSKFSSLPNMKRHRKYCSDTNNPNGRGKNKKRYTCSVCSIQYSRLIFLSHHYKRFITDQAHKVILGLNKDNECILCQVKYDDQITFREHFQNIHLPKSMSWESYIA